MRKVQIKLVFCENRYSNTNYVKQQTIGRPVIKLQGKNKHFSQKKPYEEDTFSKV